MVSQVFDMDDGRRSISTVMEYKSGFVRLDIEDLELMHLLLLLWFKESQ